MRHRRRIGLIGLARNEQTYLAKPQRNVYDTIRGVPLAHRLSLDSLKHLRQTFFELLL